MRPDEKEALGDGMLAPQSVTERGIPDADSAAPDGRGMGTEASSSDQTPPRTSCEESVVTAPGGPSPAAKDIRYDVPRRMRDHNAGRTTDIGDR